MNSIENCSQTLLKIVKVCFYRFMSLYNNLQNTPSLFLVPARFIFLILRISGYQFPCLLKLSTHWCIITFKIVIVVATVCSFIQPTCCIPRQFHRGVSSCFGQLYLTSTQLWLCQRSLYTVFALEHNELVSIRMIQNTNWEQH